MKLNKALDIFNIILPKTEFEILELYNQKRATLLSIDLQFETITKELNKLEAAYIIILKSINCDKENQEKSSINLCPSKDIIRNTLSNDSDTKSSAYISCLDCGFTNPIDAISCLCCGNQISRPCPFCGKPVTLNQEICNNCNTPIKYYDAKVFANVIEQEKRILTEREKIKANIKKTEKLNCKFLLNGIMLWFFILSILAGLIFLAIYFFNIYFISEIVT
ncbi:MAG: hypothetical protein AB2L18_09060 [Anaerolineaceae bacterium]